MEDDLGHSLTRLARDQMLRVRNVRGMCLVVFHGMAWLTQEGDTRDRLLTSGESFTFDRQGVALIHALEATSLVILDGDATHAVALEEDAPVHRWLPRSWRTQPHYQRRARRLRSLVLGRAWHAVLALPARTLAYVRAKLAGAPVVRPLRAERHGTSHAA